MKINFEFAEVYKDFINDFLSSNHQRYSLYGGRDSGKSTAAYMLELLTVLSQGSVMIVRRYKTNIAGSSYNGLKKIISKYKLDDYFKIKRSPLQIICKHNGYEINFQGLDSFDKLKSGEAPVGDYKLLVFEEAQEIPRKELCDEVISTFERGEGSDGFKCLYIFNPPANKKHWTNVELRDGGVEFEKTIKNEGYLKALKVNYYDIPPDWVGKQQLKEIEIIKKTKPKLYRYRYLGEPISAEDVVFENIITDKIKQEDIDNWEYNDDFVYCGLDFGYEDPNAAISSHYDPVNRTLYIYREFYKNHIHNNADISNGLIKAGFRKDYIIRADSASKKDIADLNSMNWNIVGSNKGHGSVTDGFKWLQGLNAIIIDPVRCPNAVDEFQSYHFELDKNGVITDNKLFKWNQADHVIAAVRYALEPIWQKAGG